MLWLDERTILEETEVAHLLVLKELDAYNEAMAKGERVSKPPFTDEQVGDARMWYQQKIAPYHQALVNAVIHNQPEPYRTMREEWLRRQNSIED